MLGRRVVNCRRMNSLDRCLGLTCTACPSDRLALTGTVHGTLLQAHLRRMRCRSIHARMHAWGAEILRGRRHTVAPASSTAGQPSSATGERRDTAPATRSDTVPALRAGGGQLAPACSDQQLTRDSWAASARARPAGRRRREAGQRHGPPRPRDGTVRRPMTPHARCAMLRAFAAPH